MNFDRITVLLAWFAIILFLCLMIESKVTVTSNAETPSNNGPKKEFKLSTPSSIDIKIVPKK